MGQVYLAEDAKLGRKVALKLLPTSCTRDESRLRRFQQEARAASALNHPNILTIHELGGVNGEQFIATEFVEGETLRDRLKRAPLNLAETFDVAVQIAGALAAAHKAGIVHRDIKPENIMLRHDGYVKVLDFGLAKLTEQHEPPTQTRATENVDISSGLVMGTVKYMSPEQARGRQVDPRSDIFSFGVVLYEMIAGYPPFEGTNSNELISAILKAEPSPLTDVPDQIQRLLSRALRKKKEDRYPTIEELLADLKSLKEDKTFTNVGAQDLHRRWTASTKEVPAISTATNIESVISGIKRHKTGMALGFVTLVVLLGGVSYIGYTFFYTRRLTIQPFASDGRVTTNTAPSGTVRVLAVVPCKPLSVENRDEALELGMAEDLVTKLGNIRGLIVRSISAREYAGIDHDHLAAGRKLQADSVLDCSIQRSSDRIKVTARQVRVVDGQELWAEPFDQEFTNIFSVQETIARRVVGELALQLSDEEEKRLQKRYTDKAAAKELYERGRYHVLKVTPKEVRKGIASFQQAVEVDPEYALAYSGIAYAYEMLPIASDTAPKEAFPKAKDAVTKALQLDDSLAEAHTVLGQIKFWFEWDWAGSEQEFRRAIELNPNYADAHRAYAQLLSNTGRHEEALAEAERARELEHLSMLNNTLEGQFLHFAGRDEEARSRFEKTFELEPNFWAAHINYAYFLIHQKKYGPALTELNKARKQIPGNTQAISLAGYVLALSGERERARVVLQELKTLSQQRYVPPYNLAVVHHGLGEREEALAWLEKAYEERDVWLTFLAVDRKWATLRDDQRFVRLLERMDLRQ
jgi:serine/threonine-protein kinase